MLGVVSVQKLYQDSVLCIYEVPIPFPTGFFFQEVATKPQKWKIFGVRKKNADVKNDIKAIQECRRNVENAKFFIEDSSEEIKPPDMS